MQPSPWNTRADLPHVLAQLGLATPNSMGVEVGVQRGEFASYILSRWPGHIALVDPWRWLPSYRDAANYDNTIQDAFRNETIVRCNAAGPGRFSIVRELSLEASLLFAGSNRDFVYLDADHSYEAVKADIAAWWPAVRGGGVLAGHDYIADGYYEPGSLKPSAEYREGMSEFGVIRAVTEFSAREGLQVWVTNPVTDGGWASWLVVKP